MALRLRRGTDAERLQITPAQGELIYTTDTKVLYVGDGSTVGGTLVTGGAGSGSATLDGLIDTDLTNAENGDALVFNSGTNRWEAAEIPGLSDFGLDDLEDVFIDINTRNTGDFLVLDSAGNFTNQPLRETFAEDANWRINIIGDDSTILVNTDNNTLSGTLVGDVLGDVDGDVTGNLTGDVTGNLNGDVFGNVFGNVIGDLQGDLSGSVFSEDSSLIVDGTTNTITADSVNTNLLNSSINTPIVLQNVDRTPVRISAITDGNPGGFPYTEYLSIKGTFLTPESVAPGDIVGGWKISGYDAAAGIGKSTTILAARLMADAVITDTSPNSLTSMLVSGGGTNTSSFDFYGSGQFKSPGAITPGVYADAAARDAAITTPTAGMMVFVTDIAKFQGYDGSAWVNLN